MRQLLGCGTSDNEARGFQQGVKFRQLDIKTAYLIASFDREIYMDRPEVLKSDKYGLVCKFERSLYRLELAPYWYSDARNRDSALLSLEDALQRGRHFWWTLVCVDDLVYGL